MGVPTSPRGPKINHLFFADDSLIFCKTNSQEWVTLSKILDYYEEVLGQRLNKEKTAIFFGRNTSRRTDFISKLSWEFPRRSVLIPVWGSLLWLENPGSGSSK